MHGAAEPIKIRRARPEDKKNKMKRMKEKQIQKTGRIWSDGGKSQTHLLRE